MALVVAVRLQLRWWGWWRGLADGGIYKGGVRGGGGRVAGQAVGGPAWVVGGVVEVPEHVDGCGGTRDRAEVYMGGLGHVGQTCRKEL